MLFQLAASWHCAAAFDRNARYVNKDRTCFFALLNLWKEGMLFNLELYSAALLAPRPLHFQKKRQQKASRFAGDVHSVKQLHDHVAQQRCPVPGSQILCKL